MKNPPKTLSLRDLKIQIEKLDVSNNTKQILMWGLEIAYIRGQKAGVQEVQDLINKGGDKK